MLVFGERVEAAGASFFSSSDLSVVLNIRKRLEIPDFESGRTPSEKV